MSTCTAFVAHEIPDRPPLQLEPGDVVDVGRRDTDWPAFVLVTSDAGSGWVPDRHLEIDGDRGVAVSAYDTTELPTGEGDRLDVVDRDEASGWTWCRDAAGREGWVPDRTLRFTG